eukprot:c28796_g1_i2 orf=299-1462(+)
MILIKMRSTNIFFIQMFSVLSFQLFTFSKCDDAKCHFPAVFNFGDSNSDTGGLSAAFGLLPSPYGMTYFQKPAGRYCDGRLVIDFISQELGLPYLDAYLQSVGSNLKHGVNFATAGSTIRPPNTTLFSPFSLDVQLSQFVEFKQRVLTYSRKEPYTTLLPNPNDFQKALYVIDIGQNDLTLGLFLDLTVKQVEAFIPEVLQEFSSHVKTLYDQGGRSFMIMNTGPLGCLPLILTRLPYKQSQLDFRGCATPYNNVAKYYNQLLRSAVDSLRRDLPNSTLVLVDTYELKYSLFEHAHTDGFRFTLKACCGFGDGIYNFNRTVRCGQRVMLEGATLTYNVCKNPSVYVNWDGVHYTEAANHIVGNGIFTGNFTNPTFPGGHICDLYSVH